MYFDVSLEGERLEKLPPEPPLEPLEAEPPLPPLLLLELELPLPPPLARDPPTRASHPETESSKY